MTKTSWTTLQTLYFTPKTLLRTKNKSFLMQKQHFPTIVKFY